MARTKKNKELNLLAALDRGKQRQKAGKGVVALIAVVVVLAAGVGLFLMYTINEGDGFTERRDAALAFVDDPGTKAQYDESIANQREASRSQSRADALTGAVESINSYPDMSGDDFKTTFKIAGKQVNLSNISYDRSTGILSFDAKCGSAEHIPVFIADLRSSGVFFDVYYDGYSGGSYTVAGEPDEDGAVKNSVVTEYSFSVTCLVNTDAQRGAA
ncbi:MAG: hypothetical protein LBL54_03090 [Clostridiales Family XIII bacterium]|jgi:hypothetical protein|nr:hypothetical protein [Clostridiales Family XIII bacterium]